ncbi:MAG: hypothetical protein OXH68_21160 [Gammaproteobacteria bacterium]|nr:hypothetical protein [Gammaproteobacteria bacterium]
MARWVRNDGYALLWLPVRHRRRGRPERDVPCVSSAFVAVSADHGGWKVVNSCEAPVIVRVETRQAIAAVAATSPPGGRKRQRSSPEWAETASRARFAAGETPSGTVCYEWRRRIERGP